MRRYYLYIALALLGMQSCTNDVTDDAPQMRSVQMQHAGQLGSRLADGLCTAWNNDDAITLLMGSEKATVTAQDEGRVANFANPFVGEGALYGVYPQSAAVGADEQSITVSLPASQTPNELTGYDMAATIAVAAASTDSLVFHTICSGLKLNFTMSGVTKIELESVDGYPLSGTAQIAFDEQGLPVVSKVEGGNNIITYTAPTEAGFTPGKDYYISVLPCDLYGGYRLSIYKDGLKANYFGVHQTADRTLYIAPNDLVESDLEFDDPDAPLVEETRPQIDATTNELLHIYQKSPTEENKQALLDQMGLRYDKVVARKKAKLRELEREAKTHDLIDEMQEIVDEMVENREIRLEQQFLRLIDPRTDDNPNDEWMVLRGAPDDNAYIGYTPVTNAQYAAFDASHVYAAGHDDYPVVDVSEAQATAYCQWLSEKSQQYDFRLPTDEEWIFAAGHMPKDVAMNAGHVESGLTPVDAYKQTTGACGGIDFWGNCWEWTSSTASNGHYIIKGGSWDADRDDCRSEKSDVTRSGAQGYANVGFRVVRVDKNLVSGIVEVKR